MKISQKIKQFFGMNDREIAFRVVALEGEAAELSGEQGINDLIEGGKLKIVYPTGFASWYQGGDEMIEGKKYESIVARFDGTVTDASIFFSALQAVLLQHGIRTEMVSVR